MLVHKISTLIGVLHRVKKYFPKSILITIYKSLITPHLNYGLLLWGNRRSHSKAIFKNLKLLNMGDLFTWKKIKSLHKLAHNTLPTYFNSYRQFLIKRLLLTIYVIMPCHCREFIMCLQKKVLCTNLLNYIMILLMIPIF